MAEHTRTDCRTTEGVTVGLIDSIITAARALVGHDFNTPAITAALADLRTDQDVRSLLAEPGVDQSANWVLGRVREALGTPNGRAVSVHAAEVRKERDTWEAEYERVRDLKLTDLADALAERDGLQARLDELKRSYELKVQDFARETARVSAGLRACTVTPTNEHVPQHIVGEALLGWIGAQEHIGDAIRNGALRAKLQGDQPARMSRDDEVLGVCRDAVERRWTVEQLAERIRAVYDPALAEQLRHRARTAEAAGFGEPDATPPDGHITDTDHQEPSDA